MLPGVSEVTDALAVRAKGLRFAYRRNQWVIRDVDLQVPRGQICAVLGPSGAGKSTLLRLLAGLLHPQQGIVEVLGADIHNHLPATIRRRIGYIPQQLGLIRSRTALENVLMGALGRLGGLGPLLGLFPKEEVERARSLLSALGIEDKAHEKAFRLSGGERQRVAIGRALMQEPLVIMADEFVSDLDLPLAAEILGKMRQLVHQKGLSLVVNMHELPLVREYVDIAIVLKQGQIIFSGPAQELTWSLLEEARR